ncbi:S-type pyocin domain-containing protein [Streptomyces sp. NPDC091385]|uniref:S-type pyocin domain-containing protein n=1 Tax=Streptomyces sp. NPDC091385 TaxID=3365997 RepID=UPI0037FEA3A3
MRAEENRSDDNVIAFRQSPEAADPAAGDRSVPDSGREAETPRAMVLNAERGIINTGTVHGGQHVTTIELSAHADDGAPGER